MASLRPARALPGGGEVAAARRTSSSSNRTLPPTRSLLPLFRSLQARNRLGARRLEASDSNEASTVHSGGPSSRRPGSSAALAQTPPPSSAPSAARATAPPSHTHQTTTTPTTPTTDAAFAQAAQRLEALLRGAQDGEDELLQAALEAAEEGDGGAAERLRLSAALGCLVTAAAVAICWLCGRDPTGGASLSASSLRAAAVGALLAAPVAAARHWGWSSPAAAEALPVLPDLRLRLAQASGPWVRGLAPAQLACLAAAETLPVTFLLLPAAQGAFSASWAWAASAAAGAASWASWPAAGAAAAAASSSFASAAAVAAAAVSTAPVGGAGGAAAAVAVSSSSSSSVAAAAAAAAATAAAATTTTDSTAAAVVALAVTAAVAAAARYADLCPTQAEYDAVGAAVASCDRFYRLTGALSPAAAMMEDDGKSGRAASPLLALDIDNSGDAAPPPPEQAALAFKAVALSWASVREDAASAGAAVQAADVLLLGAIWHATGDFTSAAVAALIVAGVDYHHLQRYSSD